MKHICYIYTFFSFSLFSEIQIIDFFSNSPTDDDEEHKIK